MAKKKVSIQIEGRNYSLISADDSKYVHSVANEVTKSIHSTAQLSKQFDTRDCAVLTALNFCDDRNKAIKRNKDLVEKADRIIKQSNELNKMCNEYKNKLTEAINDNTTLVKKIKELEAKLSELQKENEQLKSDLSNACKPADSKAETGKHKSFSSKPENNTQKNFSPKAENGTQKSFAQNNASIKNKSTEKTPYKTTSQNTCDKNEKNNINNEFNMKQCSLFEENDSTDK